MVPSSIIPSERLPSITVPIATTCFERRQERLREIICRIVPKTVLESALDRSLSGMEWEDPWEVGLNL